MERLETYGDFRPTALDHAGAFLDDDRQGWIVGPCSITRDSGPLALSNWHTMLRVLGCSDECDTDDVEIRRLGHWGPGWFEIVIIRPDSQAHRDAEDMAKALEDYPVLDEMDWSERDLEAACEAWDATTISDRIEILARHGLSIFAARRDEIPQGLPHFDDFYESRD